MQNMGTGFGRKGDFPAHTLYVGIDIAKYRHCARAIDGTTGEATSAMFFTARRKGFEELVAQIGKWQRRYGSGQVVMALEPTARYWNTLYEYLGARGYEVHMVSSLKVKQSKQVLDNSPLKSDPKDALIIAKLLKDKNFSLVRDHSEDICAVKVLLAHHEDISRDIRCWENRLEQFKAERFPELDDVFRQVNSRTVRALLSAYPFPEDIVNADMEEVTRFLWEVSRGAVDRAKAQRLVEAAHSSVGVKGSDTARWIVRDILTNLETCHERLRICKKRIEETLGKIPSYEILKTIPGVSVMTGAAILSALGDLGEYESAREVLKKAGLNLYRHSSGKFRGADRISHRGSALLRKILYMSAVYHANKGAPLHEYYQNMVRRGVAKKKALVAVMRKLLKVAFALVRDGRGFDAPKRGAAGAVRDVAVIRRAEAA